MDKEYATAKERVSGLPLDEQEKAIAELRETVSVLTSMLSPVLFPEQEVADKTATEPSEYVPRSPVKERLELNTSRIRLTIRQLESLIERLEC